MFLNLSIVKFKIVKKYHKKKIVIFAYNQIGYESIQILSKQNCKILYVITHINDPNENIWFKSISNLCKKLKIKLLYYEKTNFDSILKKLIKHDIYCIFSFYFRKLIPTKILKLAKIGSINVHGSYLPKYRGRSPINWQIINGEKISGVTYHFMDKEADSGNIIFQKKIKILKKDTAISLQKKINQESNKILINNFKKIINNQIKSSKQNEKKATIYGGRKPEDGLLSFDMNSKEVNNMVRGLSFPFPGAFFFYKKHKIVVNKCSISKNKIFSKENIFIRKNKLFFKAFDKKNLVIEEIIQNNKKIKGPKIINYFKKIQ